jgi:hypothetical protein
MNACIITSDFFEREYNNLFYKEAHASYDDGRRREANYLVCCSLLQLVQSHLRLFGAFKIEGKCKKGTKVWSYTCNKHPTTKMVSFGTKN